MGRCRLQTVSVTAQRSIDLESLRIERDSSKVSLGGGHSLWEYDHYNKKSRTKTERCRWSRCGVHHAQTLWRVFDVIHAPPSSHKHVIYLCPPPLPQGPPWAPSPRFQVLSLPLHAFAAIRGWVMGQGQNQPHGRLHPGAGGSHLSTVRQVLIFSASDTSDLLECDIQVFTDIAKISNVDYSFYFLKN